MAHPWDDEWEVIRPLRTGGQGVTRLVRSKQASQRQGVLKYLLNNRSTVARARMRREVANLQTLAALGGRVPQVLSHNSEAYENSSVELYLVMEFVDGPTLKEHVEHQRKLSIDRASDFALALCETVKIAHTEGILHRDIKPDNIIIRDAERNELYIVDYGLSFNATDEDLTETVETFRNKFLDLPETNTPGGNRRDPRSDVTALCAVFYYMLSGHHPGHLQDASGKMPHLRPGFTVRDAVASDARTTQVELILSRGLAPQLQSRFQTIDEFAARLASLRQQSSSCPTSDPIATAAELSARLREQDRKTQLVEFQPAANKMLTEFASKLNAIGKKLGRFKLKAGGGGRDGPKLGDGLDPVSGPFTATVSVANHEAKRFRTYKVASRGEQCVVCACDFRSEADKTKPAPTDWREIAWYEGTSTDVIPVLEREFMQWLDGAIQQIAQQVFAG